MQIVLPGALPDPREARELTSHLHDAAPTLVQWLQQSHATQKPVAPAQTGCTPYEQWLLDTLGFTPVAGQNLAAGLGPLSKHRLAQQHSDNGGPGPDQAVWMTELVHISPSRDGAALLPARQLSISTEQSVALFESAQGLFAETGFTLHYTGTVHWRLDIPAEFIPQCASPELVGMTTVNDWWPAAQAARPWRRLINELQMLWFENSVNRDRAALGHAPVNSLWLFGGGAANQFQRMGLQPERVVHNELLAASLEHDWNSWIAALIDLEARVFRPWAESRRVPELILLGTDRLIQTRPQTLARWTQWLPSSRNKWRKWWSPQN